MKSPDGFKELMEESPNGGVSGEAISSLAHQVPGRGRKEVLGEVAEKIAACGVDGVLR